MGIMENLMNKTVLLIGAQSDKESPLGAFIEALGYSILRCVDLKSLETQLSGPKPDLVVVAPLPEEDYQAVAALLSLHALPFAALLGPEADPQSRPSLAAAAFPSRRRSELLRWIDARLRTDGSQGFPTVFSPASQAEAPLNSAERRVLVIEDSPTIRSFVRRTLTDRIAGVQVLESEDGRAALHMLSQEKVHCIITDLQMPGMDGWTFLHTLRQNPILKHKPVIVLSSAISATLRASYQADPWLRFVDKPATADQLLEAILPLLKA
jgi:two-component system chemotaxis response regulator CheY